MGRSCSLTTIQAASNWRMSSSWPTQWMVSSSGCAEVQRYAFDFDRHMGYISLCGSGVRMRVAMRPCLLGISAAADHHASGLIHGSAAGMAFRLAGGPVRQ